MNGALSVSGSLGQQKLLWTSGSQPFCAHVPPNREIIIAVAIAPRVL